MGSAAAHFLEHLPCLYCCSSHRVAVCCGAGRLKAYAAWVAILGCGWLLVVACQVSLTGTFCVAGMQLRENVPQFCRQTLKSQYLCSTETFLGTVLAQPALSTWGFCSSHHAACCNPRRLVLATFCERGPCAFLHSVRKRVCCLSLFVVPLIRPHRALKMLVLLCPRTPAPTAGLLVLSVLGFRERPSADSTQCFMFLWLGGCAACVAGGLVPLQASSSTRQPLRLWSGLCWPNAFCFYPGRLRHSLLGLACRCQFCTLPRCRLQEQAQVTMPLCQCYA